MNDLDFYIRIIENSTEGLFLLNDQGEIRFVNERCTQLTGWDIDEILLRQKEFLGYFNFTNGSAIEHVLELPQFDGAIESFKYSYVTGGGNGFTLVNIKPNVEKKLIPWAGNVFKHLFYNMQDPVVSFDATGNIVTFNPSLRKLLNWTETSPETADHLYSDEDAFKNRIKELGLSKGQLSQIVSLNTYLGCTKKFYETIWPHFDKDFNILGFTAHFQDLSREELLKAQLSVSQRNYSRLFENFASSIVIVDEVGNIVNMNAVAELLYGWERDELIGVSYDDYFSAGKNRPGIVEITDYAKMNGGKYIEIGVPRNTKYGDQLYTYVSYHLVELNGDGVFAVFILEKDLTERVHLEKQLKESVYQVKETQAAAIMGFAKLTEVRDHCTGEHLDRIKEYTRVLTKTLREISKYEEYITEEYIEDISMSSILHDIGKVGIEDSVLLKAGKFTSEEFDVMKKHSMLGGEALSVIDKNVGYKSFLTIGKEVAYYHHEKWDGTGYPEGLKGSDIPLSARIVAIADVYDALISERPYKNAFSHEEAMKLIIDEKGRHFDPDIVDAFIMCNEEFRVISMGEFFLCDNNSLKG